MRPSSIRWVVWIASVVMIRPAVAQPTFTPLGFLDSAANPPFSEVSDISGDGQVVVGMSQHAGLRRAFRWSAGVMTSLGTIDGAGESFALSTNRSGTIVVGEARNGAGLEAFRWSAGSMTSLNAGAGSVATGISADGAIIFGVANFASTRSTFRWNSGVVTDFGNLPGGGSVITTGRCNAAGDWLVGDADIGANREAFRLSSGGCIPLGDLQGGVLTSKAFDISDDASVVVGSGTPSGTGGSRAVRFSAGEVQNLGVLPGGVSASIATACSADGSIVIGYSGSIEGLHPFVWTAQTGMRRLDAVIIEKGGVPPPGWSLERATGISDDGRVIAGHGLDPQRRVQAWRLDLGQGATLCPADLDDDGDVTNGYTRDGGVDINDLLAFLAGFENGDTQVDLDDDGDPASGNPDGGVDINDLIFFLSRFEGGC